MSASETLRAYLRGRDDINPATVSSLLFFHENDLAAARAESDALRAALGRCAALLPMLRSCILSGEPINALDEVVILSALADARAALAPSPAAPERERRDGTCHECGVTLSESHFMVTGHRTPRTPPTAPEREP